MQHRQQPAFSTSVTAAERSAPTTFHQRGLTRLGRTPLFFAVLTLFAVGLTLQEHIVLLTNLFPEENELFSGDMPAVQSSSPFFRPSLLSSETQIQTIPLRLPPPDEPPPPPPPPPWEPPTNENSVMKRSEILPVVATTSDAANHNNRDSAIAITNDKSETVKYPNTSNKMKNLTTKFKTEHKTVTSPQLLSLESSSNEKSDYGRASRNSTESSLLPSSNFTTAESKKNKTMSDSKIVNQTTLPQKNFSSSPLELMLQSNKSKSFLANQSLLKNDVCTASSTITTPHPASGSLCHRLTADGKTISSLWLEALPRILNACMHPDDLRQIHRPWIQQLLKIVTPQFLERSLLVRLGEKNIRRVIGIIELRLQNATKHPPLLVAVYGGSVAEGTGCNKIPAELGNLEVIESIKGKNCAWPLRLQWLADTFLGSDVVRVENIAVGGTHSILALPTLEYRLYPKNSLMLQSGPDIIVNGYSVNDNLPNTEVKDNSTADRRHFQLGLDKSQKFTLSALKSRPCRDPPSLIYFDEYFGNQNELLLGEDIRRNAVRLVAGHYGGSVGVISSSVMATPFVYTNERETFFSPNWWKNSKKRITDGHFGMPGHQLTAYSIAYAALRTVADYCAGTMEHHRLGAATSTPQKQEEVIRTMVSPKLVDELKFSSKHDASHETKWEQEEAAYCANADFQAPPCPFAFVATPAGTARHANELNKYLLPFTTNNTGWTGENDIRNGWQNKLGLTTHTHGAVLELTLPHVTNRVRILTLHYLRSYGEKWANSTAQFDLTILKNETIQHTRSFRVEGVHDMTFSIAYPLVVDLGDHAADIGDDVVLRITLAGGSEFKIIALMLCSR